MGYIKLHYEYGKIGGMRLKGRGREQIGGIATGINKNLMHLTDEFPVWDKHHAWIHQISQSFHKYIELLNIFSLTFYNIYYHQGSKSG